MAEPQPGLLPIIPRFPAQPGPSPLIPVIVLFIVGTLRYAVLKVLDVWSEIESNSFEWTETVESIQTHFIVTALLIPVCLLLVLHAFGMPQVNPVMNAPPPSPFVKAVTQNLGSSVLLVVVILALLLSIPVRSIIHSPWQPEATVTQYKYVRSSGGRRSGVCQEIAILKKRCENWKGNARHSVCRDLAVLQKRCEKSKF